jgi:hypothetical protein
MTLSKTSLLFVLSVLMCAAAFTSQAQTVSQTKCPAVSAKNPQEALMMETGSNKQGCWVRDKKTGLLMFVNSLAPNKNYKPLVRTQTTGKPTCDGTGGGPTMISGNWLVDLKCVSNCLGGNYDDALETVTITARGPKTYNVAFGSFPNADACADPLMVSQSSLVAYAGTDGLNGNPPPREHCGGPRTVELVSTATSLKVKLSHTDNTWQGTACLTSALQGAWIPTYPPSGYWMAAPR